MEKGKRFFVISVFIIVFVLFFAIVAGVVSWRLTGENKSEHTKSTNAVQINWEELYPYTVEIDTVKKRPKQDDISSPAVSKFEKKLDRLKTYSTVNWATLIYNYDDLAKLGYIVNSRLTDSSVGETYVRLKNGHWITPSYKTPVSYAEDEIVPYASLQNYLNKNGIPFLFFYAPWKECAVDNELPNGVVSYTNENIDQYLELMDSYMINYVDFRKVLHNDGLDHYKMFYVTDHHWIVEAGLWAASKIVQELDSRYGFSMPDPYEAGEYDLVTYERAEFGSMGRGVSRYVASPEDFTVPYPMFNTEYRVEVPTREIDVTGSFEEIFIDRDGLQEIIEQGGGEAYGRILYGNPPFEKITNLNDPDGPKVLMIRDSFSNVVAPYLAGSCSELLLLDTRPENGNFSGSIISCIDDFEPDIVIILQCYPHMIVLNK